MFSEKDIFENSVSCRPVNCKFGELPARLVERKVGGCRKQSGPMKRVPCKFRCVNWQSTASDEPRSVDAVL